MNLINVPQQNQDLLVAQYNYRSPTSEVPTATMTSNLRSMGQYASRSQVETKCYISIFDNDFSLSEGESSEEEGKASMLTVISLVLTLERWWPTTKIASYWRELALVLVQVFSRECEEGEKDKGI